MRVQTVKDVKMNKRDKITMAIAAPIALVLIVLNITTHHVFESHILQDLMVASITVVLILLVNLSIPKKPN
jgi:hypothetical protein